MRPVLLIDLLNQTAPVTPPKLGNPGGVPLWIMAAHWQEQLSHSEPGPDVSFLHHLDPGWPSGGDEEVRAHQRKWKETYNHQGEYHTTTTKC